MAKSVRSAQLFIIGIISRKISRFIFLPKESCKKKVPWCVCTLGPASKELDWSPGWGCCVALLNRVLYSYKCLSPPRKLWWNCNCKLSAKLYAVLRKNSQLPEIFSMGCGKTPSRGLPRKLRQTKEWWVIWLVMIVRVTQRGFTWRHLTTLCLSLFLF